MISHQSQQKKVIREIEKQIATRSIQFSTVTPIENYDNDNRRTLTSIHFPKHELKQQIKKSILDPLKKIVPDYYYYEPDSLHMTIKNIRVADYPPRFTKKDIQKTEILFAKIIPKHRKFNVYFYKLILFPYNLSLIGTTNPELDRIILDLDSALTIAGIPDDKVYTNSKYFFSNMTLARFNKHPTQEFKHKVQALSDEIRFKPYCVDSITLLECNAACKQLQLVRTWILK